MTPAAPWRVVIVTRIPPVVVGRAEVEGASRLECADAPLWLVRTETYEA